MILLTFAIWTVPREQIREITVVAKLKISIIQNTFYFPVNSRLSIEKQYYSTTSDHSFYILLHLWLLRKKYF